MSGFECALCGLQCRISAKRRSLDTAYDGKGLPPAKELERFVPESWRIRRGMQTVALPALPKAKWLHNESASSGKDCYKICGNVWKDVSMEQVAASANPGPGRILPHRCFPPRAQRLETIGARRARGGTGENATLAAPMRQSRKPSSLSEVDALQLAAGHHTTVAEALDAADGRIGDTVCDHLPILTLTSPSP